MITRAFHSSRLVRSAQNHYQILGLSVNASPTDIKKRFYELSKEYHPDKQESGDLKKYQQITEAYAILSDEDQRKKFDLTLGSAVRRPEGYKPPPGQRPWQGRTRAKSGYQYHEPMQARAAHPQRQNPDLDPLKPRSGGWQRSDDVRHFDFDAHVAKHQRYASYRSQQAREDYEARAGPKSTDRQVSSGASVMGMFVGGATAVGALFYLLLR